MSVPDKSIAENPNMSIHVTGSNIFVLQTVAYRWYYGGIIY